MYACTAAHIASKQSSGSARLRTGTIGILLAFSLLTGPSRGQDFRPTVPAQTVVPRPSAGSRKVQLLQIEDRSVNDVMKILSDLGGWTIICSPSVRQQKVTLFVKEIPADELLDMVVLAAGLEYRKEGDTIVILTREEYGKVYGLAKLVCPLRHARAKDVVDYVKGFLTKEGRIAADMRGNKLIVEDTPASLRELQKALAELDREVTTQVVPLQFAEATQVAAALQALPSLPVQIAADERANQIVIEGAPEAVVRAAKIIGELDREDVVSTRVFVLEHADCAQVAALVQEMLGRPATSAYGGQGRRDREGRSPTDESKMPATSGPETLSTRSPSAGTLREQALRRAAQQARERAATAEREAAERAVSTTPPAMEEAPQPGGPAPSAEVAVGAVGTVVADPRTNAVIVTEAPAVLDRISEVIEQIDVEVEMHTYRLSYADPAELALEEKLAALLNAASDRFEIDPRTRLVTYATSPAKARKVEELLVHWDEPAREVFIEGEVLSVSLNKLKEAGLDLEAIFSPDFRVRSNFPPSFLPPPGATLTIGDLETSGFHGVIDLLESKGIAKLLSSPRIRAKHQRPATFSVATAEPYTEVVIDAAAQITSENVQFVDVGILLTVVPQINDEGIIELEVALEAGQLVEVREGVPVVDRSIARSTVLVKDGHTVAMGGLITNNRKKQVDKVPLFGDIPLLGAIFRRTRITDDRSQLLLLLTPHIVTPEGTPSKPTVDELYDETVGPKGDRPAIELIP